MARSKRPVVKVVLSMAVLAAAGAGVYHFITNDGWSLLKGLGSAPMVQLVSDETPATDQAGTSASNLDAVASAWVGPTAPDPRPHSTYGSARSADYGKAATSTRDPHVARASYTAADADHTDPEPDRIASDDQPYRATELDDDRYATPGPTPMALTATAEDDSVTRGQNEADDAAEDAAATSNNGNPLRSSSQHADASSRRAKEAFADDQQLTADERYGHDSSDANPYRAGATEEPRQVNPFASQPAPLPSSMRSADPIKTDRIQELEDAPRVARIPRSGAEFSATNSDGLSSAPYSGDSSKFDSDRRSIPQSSLPSMGSSDLRSRMDASYGSDAEGTGRPGERALEGPQQPSVVIQKFAPQEIQVGKPAKFIVQVQNVGRRPADDVIIRDELPHGTKFVSSSPRADVSGAELTWQLGTLSAGEQRAVEVQLMPTEEGEIGSVATVSFSAPASVKTLCTMPQLAIRMTAPSQVMIGEEQQVKIELRNPGSGDATGVMLFENVPQQVRHEAGPSLEFEIGTLRAGETREMTLILTAEQAGQVVNTLTARADGNLQVQQQVDFEVIAPGLELAVDGPSRRYLERPATYQVTIANPGTAAAKDVEIVTKLPKGMKFIRANNMGEYDASTHAIYWSLAELPEGERGSVELVAMPVESGEHTLEVEGRAQRGLTDQTKQQILVEGLAAIKFDVTDLEDPIEVGRETTYEIRVANQGTKAATNVQVAVNVPAGMQVVSAAGETRHVIESGGVLFEPLAQLAPKAESVFRVQVQGIRPGDQRVTVEVNTDDNSQPIRKEESTRVFGDE